MLHKLYVLGINDNFWDTVRELGSETGKGAQSRASGYSDKHQKSRNNIHGLLRAMRERR